MRSARRARGQVLVIFAALIPVVALLFLFALGLAALLDVRAHAAYALGVATRAGARQVEYAGYGEGRAFFDGEVERTVRDAFERALEMRTTGLAGSPGEIAGLALVEIGYGSRDEAWQSTFGQRPHYHPTVAARAMVPVQVWMFEITLSIVSETEVR